MKPLNTLIWLALIFFAAPAVFSAQTQYDAGDPSADEQLVLEMINRARADPIAEGTRLKIDIHEGLQNPSLVKVQPPLAMNKTLLAVARAHSQDMYQRNYFDHVDPDGKDPFDRMTAAGYNFTTAGENIATGTFYSSAALEDLLMVDSGISGRGHRVNLLDITSGTIFREIGVGYFSSGVANASGFNTFLTQDFGTSSTGPFIVGVVYDDKNNNGFYDKGEGMAGVTITPASGNFFAVSSTSGGFAIPVGTSGSLTLTASGGSLTADIVKNISLTGDNIKVDFKASEAGTTGGGGGGTKPAITSSLNATGTVGTFFSYTIAASGTTPITFSAAPLPQGLSFSGNMITGTPTQAGSFLVTLNADNTSGSDTQLLAISIFANNSGGDITTTFVSNSKTDTDSDGFPDELEASFGTSSSSSLSTPLGGGAVTPEPLLITKIGVKLNFKKMLSDSVSATGFLPAPANFVVAGQTATVDFGGIINTFTLDPKGVSPKDPTKSFKLKVKAIKGVVLGQNSQFQLKLAKSTLSPNLTDEGMVNDNSVAVGVPVPIIILFNGVEYRADELRLYNAKKDSSGKVK